MASKKSKAAEEKKETPKQEAKFHSKKFLEKAASMAGKGKKK